MNLFVNVKPISVKMKVILPVACKYNGSNAEFGYKIVTSWLHTISAGLCVGFSRINLASSALANPNYYFSETYIV